MSQDPLLLLGLGCLSLSDGTFGGVRTALLAFTLVTPPLPTIVYFQKQE